MGGLLMIKTMRRNAFMPLIVAAQVVFALVVLVNVGGLLHQQMVPILASSGVPPGELLLTRQISSGGAHLKHWSYATIRSAERAVRAMPGVTAVSNGLGLPFTADGLRVSAKPTDVRTQRSTDADIFAGDDLVDTLGLRLLRGRGFSNDEYVTGNFSALYGQARVALLTRALARRLFPGGKAVGQSIWLSPKPSKNRAPIRVIGVVTDTLGSRISGNKSGRAHAVVLLPYHLDGLPFMSFMVRAQPARRGAVMQGLPKVLGAALGVHDADAIKLRRYEDVREAAIHSSKLASWLLLAVLGTVSVVVMLGITGLSSFWVQKRTREIGIQRALGARRGDILRQYHLENLLVVCAGVVIGVVLGLVVAAWLRMHFELASPPITAWAVGSLVLIAFGQLAVLGPALRASRVPPVVATRSV